ncbi:MAG: hypothetical protein KatS3mg105_3906 [Gemmatales bacterium]|nr:MAG: hypothetical protein KatS3mg105_3906 [Gemmatales bacterium]
MAALLSSEIEDGNKRDIMVQHIDDARRLGIEVKPPNVNAGEADFTVADGAILFVCGPSKVWGGALPRKSFVPATKKGLSATFTISANALTSKW